MLDEATQKVFDEIVAKEPESLTPEDLGFLWARQSYLSDEQLDKFESVLRQPDKKEVFQVVEKLDRTALMRRAKSMGIKIARDMTAPQVKALIDDLEYQREMEKERIEEEKAAEEAAELAKQPQKGHVGNFENVVEGEIVN